MNNVFRAKFPSWDMVFALSPRELAYEITVGMNEKMAMAQPGGINWSVNGLASGIASGYADTPENRRIIMEGVEMMFSMGLLTESGTVGDPYVYRTRIGRDIRTADGIIAHQSRNLDAYSMLDSRIRDAVWTPYLKGDYDIAIAYAFKRVEVAMRDKGTYSANDVGERIIEKFFSDFRLPGAPDEPKPATLTFEENLFIGGFGLYRNPASHIDITVEEPARAMEVLLIANHLLHLVNSAIRRTI